MLLAPAFALTVLLLSLNREMKFAKLEVVETAPNLQPAAEHEHEVDYDEKDIPEHHEFARPNDGTMDADHEVVKDEAHLTQSDRECVSSLSIYP